MPLLNADLPPDTACALHPADEADRLQRLGLEEALEELKAMPVQRAAAVLAEMEWDRIPDLFEETESEDIAAWLEAMSHQRAADLAGLLPEERLLEVMAALPPEIEAAVGRLLRYPDDTAGGLMSDRFIALEAGATVGESLARLQASEVRSRQDDVGYLYVIDSGRRLKGIVPLRELVFCRPERPLREIMHADVAAVNVRADQEDLARQFQRYRYLGLPVVDDDHRLLGVVRAADVYEAAQEEATEDMQLMVGLSGEERALTPWPRSVGRRLPWLFVNLATAVLAASVVGLFESTIGAWTALAVFLPIIAGQGGNAGIQTLTIIVRDMALGELSPGDGRKALLKEGLVALINGLAVGLVLGLIGFLWKGSIVLGVVAATAMVLTQLAAALAGVSIPFGLRLLRVDPALASSIFVTTVTDVSGFLFFLALAAFALKYYGG